MNPKENAELELKHIQLELSYGRSQHLRHFIDQYYCYENGYLNKNGNPNWNLIFWSNCVSKKAEEVTEKKLIVKEHVIPLKVITDLLKQLSEDCTTKEIKKIIDTNLHFATITKEEDAILRKVGLNQKMPAEYYDPKSKLYNDIFARYKKTNIEYNDRNKSQ